MHKEDPLHILHDLLIVSCSQYLLPLHSRHSDLTLLCSQILDPLHSLHEYLILLCSQISVPPHPSKHRVGRVPWIHFLGVDFCLTSEGEDIIFNNVLSF